MNHNRSYKSIDKLWKKRSINKILRSLKRLYFSLNFNQLLSTNPETSTFLRDKLAKKLAKITTLKFITL